MSAATRRRCTLVAGSTTATTTDGGQIWSPAAAPTGLGNLAAVDCTTASRCLMGGVFQVTYAARRPGPALARLAVGARPDGKRPERGLPVGDDLRGRRSGGRTEPRRPRNAGTGRGVHNQRRPDVDALDRARRDLDHL
jgi:hypothetical protein